MIATDKNLALLSKVTAYNHGKYVAFRNSLPFASVPEYDRLLQARYQKCFRVKRRLVYLFSHFKYIWFCTFTINNDYISKCERTKRDYLKKFLNTHDFKFILNVDYGKNGTKRQHYHCILATNIDMDVNQFFQSSLNDTFGWTLSLPCLKGNDDLKRLYKYINKLANHCIKASTQNKRILYNFKGYDLLFPTYKEQSNAYFLDYIKLFEGVTLLDKGDTTGKI